MPSAAEAFDSVLYWRQAEGLGLLLRGLHYHLSSGLVVAGFVFLLATFLAGRHREGTPRRGGQGNEARAWWLGLGLFLLALLGWCFTGYLLPMDQNAYWGTVVRLGIVETSPPIGPMVAGALRGGVADHLVLACGSSSSASTNAPPPSCRWGSATSSTAPRRAPPGRGRRRRTCRGTRGIPRGSSAGRRRARSRARQRQRRSCRGRSVFHRHPSGVTAPAQVPLGTRYVLAVGGIGGQFEGRRVAQRDKVADGQAGEGQDEPGSRSAAQEWLETRSHQTEELLDIILSGDDAME